MSGFCVSAQEPSSSSSSALRPPPSLSAQRCPTPPLKLARTYRTACEDENARQLKPALSSLEWASTLDDSSGEPIVLLKFQSSPGSSGSKQQLPVINEGDAIVGSVELNLSEAKYVEEVVVTVSIS